MSLWLAIAIFTVLGIGVRVASHYLEPTRFKISKVNRRIKKMISNQGYPNSIYWYGAYDIDPKHLAIWVCVKSDKEKSELEVNASLLNRLRNILNEVNYPESARRHVHIGIESVETVNRDSGGNWYKHFK